MFKVCEQKCDQCLFGKDRIVSEKHMREVLADCERRDTYFICHKATLEGKEVCCKGFYEARTSNLIRIAQRLNMVEFVTVGTEQDAQTHDE